ncbi:MAG: cytochrome P450, partial [Solirubrobacteraceae bacterium]
TLFDDGFVMVFDPDLVKEIFQGPTEGLHAGEANSLLGPILGDRSVLLLDGAEHLRHRRLMLPSFHGRQLNGHVQTMRVCADEEIDRWPIGKPFRLLPAMQAITLNVMLRAVFGYESGPERDELARRVRSMIDPLARPRGAIALRAVLLGRDDARGAPHFEMRKRAVDELLYPEITRRRADPALAARDDVFSALLLARDSSEQAFSDREVRDELLTLLLAGHETTATGLAWTLDLLLHDRKVMQRAREGDPSYLDAVIKESLRIRTVIPGVGRVVREQPFSLGPFTVPPGMEINPSIRTIHRRSDLYPQPRVFRPERFLGLSPPDTYTWLPFGGGTRRCLGASFALTEMRVVLERILQRTRLIPADRRRARTQFRLITLGPRGGVRAIQEAAPAPGPSEP